MLCSLAESKQMAQRVVLTVLQAAEDGGSHWGANRGGEINGQLGMDFKSRMADTAYGLAEKKKGTKDDEELSGCW